MTSTVHAELGRFDGYWTTFTIGASMAAALLVSGFHTKPQIDADSPLNATAVRPQYTHGTQARGADTPQIEAATSVTQAEAHISTAQDHLSPDELLRLITAEPKSDRAFQAASRLSGLGPAGVKALIAALQKAEGADEARLLATALAMNGSGDAIEGLFQTVIASTVPEKSAAMLGALDNLTNPEGVTLLASVFAATGEHHILQAANAVFARSAVSDTVDFLAELFVEQSGAPDQRNKMLAALQGIRNPGAIPGLGSAAARADLPEFAEAAAAALVKIGTSEAVLALRDAYGVLSKDATGSAAAVRLLEAFESMTPSSENAPLIAATAEDGPSAAWSDAAQRIISGTDPSLITAGAVNGALSPHYRPMVKVSPGE